MEIDITSLYVRIAEFDQEYKKFLDSTAISDQAKRVPTRVCALSDAEMVTIILNFHFAGYVCFKRYYVERVSAADFPNKISYNRFVEQQARVMPMLALFLRCLITQSEQTPAYFIDSTQLAVCHSKRNGRNKVFAGIGSIGKSSKGWFFGFKLHLVINTCGEIMAVRFTQGNVADAEVVDDMTTDLLGSLFGDKGYIGKDLFASLWKRGLKLVTGIRSNMKNKLMLTHDKLMLRKRGLIESVFNVLKNNF